MNAPRWMDAPEQANVSEPAKQAKKKLVGLAGAAK